MATNTIPTWTKLRNGEWGIKGRFLSVGDVVTVRNKSGKSTTVTVAKVIWSDPLTSLAICAVTTDASHRRTTGAATRSHKCEICGRSGAHLATDLSGITGWACRTCDDGALSFC